MTKVLLPLLCLSIIVGASSLALFPVSTGHIGLSLFAFFCIVVPAYICHFTIGYFLARFKALRGGRYEKPNWWLDAAIFDRGFLRDVYHLSPIDAVEKRIKAAFIVSHAAGLSSAILAYLLANFFPAPV